MTDLELQKGTDSAAELGRWTRVRSRLAVIGGLSILLLLVGWVLMERGDALIAEGGAVTSLRVRPGDPFSASYGFFKAREDVIVTSAGPLVSGGLEIRDVRLFVGPGSTPGSRLPHDCEPISHPFSRGGFLGSVRPAGPVSVEAGQWFFVVVYFEAVEAGRMTTQVPVRISYRQGWWPQSQELSAGVFLDLDVSPGYPRLRDDLQCKM